MDKAAVLITGDVRTKKDSSARKASLLPSSLQHTYYLLPEACSDDDNELMGTMVEALKSHADPGPALVFPGRTGVDTVQKYLRKHGFLTIRGLEDVGLIEDHSEESAQSSWEDTPIFVVSEKLGRGLDIPTLSYVLLLQVPSSAAGYAHLAGRAGRNGKYGETISFCRPREAPKLVRIAETLDLSMKDLSGNKC